jgi:hypothetical protein
MDGGGPERGTEPGLQARLFLLLPDSDIVDAAVSPMGVH